MVLILTAFNTFLLIVGLALTAALLITYSKDRNLTTQLLTAVREAISACMMFTESAKEYMRSAHVNQQITARASEVVAHKMEEEQRQPSRSDVVRRLDKIPQETADKVTENLKSGDSGASLKPGLTQLDDSATDPMRRSMSIEDVIPENQK